MRPTQQLLFPDPKPLVERLGVDFFRTLPQQPGVYRMKDATGKILYIGKAKNLRQRLNHYRVANPDRMRRRHLRLLSSVAHIELVICPDEMTALATEAEQLREIRPKFNRAGTWPGPARFFAWRCADEELRLSILPAAVEEWKCHGPMGTKALMLREVLARLLWLGAHPRSRLADLPFGWFQGQMDPEVSVPCGDLTDVVSLHIDSVLAGSAAPFVTWLLSRLPSDLSPFEDYAIAADLELLVQCVTPKALF